MKCPYTGAACACKKRCGLDSQRARWEELALSWVSEEPKPRRGRRLVTREGVTRGR